MSGERVAGTVDGQNRLLVLSENFPPVVGGSARWAGKIAEYWTGPVDALMARKDDLAWRHSDGDITSHRCRWTFPSWAPDTPASLLGYLTYIIAALLLAARRRPAWVLVGRGLPEGVAALVIRRTLRVPYAVLAHGEEISTCESSGLLRRMLRRVYTGSDLVIANSENSRRLAVRAGAREDRCIVSHPGTHVHHFAAPVDRDAVRRELGVRDEVLLLSVGRLEWRKNHRAVISAVASLVDRGLSVAYAIAGAGEEELSLRREVRQQGVEHCVHFLGRVSEDRLAQLYGAADVFALPGISSEAQFEGFGIVFIEAAAAGVPSVCGRAGGSPEAVADGRTGLVVDGSDQQQVTDALETLVTDGDVRRAMGERARERAVRSFDWPVLMEELLKHFHRPCRHGGKE